MILIVTHELDISTYRVTEWLNYFGASYLQVSSDMKIIINKISINDGGFDFLLEVNDRQIEWSSIDSVWYRRGGLSFPEYTFVDTWDIVLNDNINKYLKEELNEIRDLIWEKFRLKSINSQVDNDINKLIVLDKCRKFNLAVPPTIVTTKKDQVIQFKTVQEKIITKNINAVMNLMGEDQYLFNYTQNVTDDMIQDLSEDFAPSLFQKNIDKAFEVRVFFLNDKFYASAIISQNDDGTKQDFRNYNSSHPNRTPPYILPSDLERNLYLLMKEIRLNCGSIDLIVDKNGKYYFLEVNPVGQFGQVSHPCNYYLSKEIAKSLVNERSRVN